VTTIAFDGRYLAVDRAACSGTLWIKGVKKLHRGKIPGRGFRDFVAAFTGDSFFCQRAAEALFEGEAFPDCSGYGYSSGSGILAIVAEVGTGKCWAVNPMGDWLPVKAPITAGAGSEFALGAIAAGTTAWRAVKLANVHTDASTGGVDFVKVK
jgi:hypothetical protein